MTQVKERIHNAAIEQDIIELKANGIIRYAMPVAAERLAEIEAISDLKLIAVNDRTLEVVPEIITNHRDFKKAVATLGKFVEVSEEFYYDNLEVLPPIWLENGCFQVDECVTRDLYNTFGKKEGKYYGCICNAQFALKNF